MMVKVPGNGSSVNLVREDRARPLGAGYLPEPIACREASDRRQLFLPIPIAA